LAKAHYPELYLDLITSGIPESGEDGAPVDEAAIRQSVLGYDQLCAPGTQLNIYYEAYDLLGSQAKLWRQSLQPPLVLMAVMRCLLEFRRPLRLDPAMWQEKTIASIRPLSGSVSLNFKLRVFALHCDWSACGGSVECF
jgi:hypothetical protein